MRNWCRLNLRLVWKPHLYESYKINVDGATDCTQSIVGIGIASGASLRGYEGSMIGAVYVETFYAIPLMTELLAIREAIEFCREIGTTEDVIGE